MPGRKTKSTRKKGQAKRTRPRKSQPRSQPAPKGVERVYTDPIQAALARRRQSL